MPFTSWSACDTDDLLRLTEELSIVGPCALYSDTGIDKIGVGNGFAPFSDGMHVLYPAAPPLSPSTMTAIDSGVAAFDLLTAFNAFPGTSFALQRPHFEPAQPVDHRLSPPSTPTHDAVPSTSSSHPYSLLEFIHAAQLYLVSSSICDLVTAALLPHDLNRTINPTINHANGWAGHNYAISSTAAMPEIQQPQPLSPPTTSTAPLTSHPIFVGATSTLFRNTQATMTADEPAAFHDDFDGAGPWNHAEPSVILTTERPRNFQCDFCDKTFFRKQDMQRHRATTHRMPGDLKFACGGCGKRFARRDACQRHVRRGLEEGKCPGAMMPDKLKKGTKPKGVSTEEGTGIQKKV
ncbi:hypothetical protein HK101_011715 [Irineochytrium annulatum]|nr:hypothetical protein HK101_011715 [Irineochytrium annulatum]